MFSRKLTATAVAALLTLPVGAVATAAAAVASPAAAFTHPGVLVSRAQLDYVKSKVNAGAEPWKSAFGQMVNNKLGSLSYKAKPRATVECGSSSKPDNGCSDERQDALAAYTMGLAWYIKGDKKYAAKAIEIMNAWSGVVKQHTNSNAPLQTGWAGAGWAKAAELIRYTNAGWSSSDVDRFATMLRDVYLPTVIKGAPQQNGNWELVMTEAAVGISVFLDDKSNYDKAMQTFRSRVPAYVYLSSDGGSPKAPPGAGAYSNDRLVSYWQGQKKFVDGLTQETCRDFAHTGYGVASIADVAETARIQGQDLYGTDVGKRLQAALELHTQYENGAKMPSWLCNGSKKRELGPVTEVAFNALHNRMKADMPNTQTYVNKHRPEGTNSLYVAWDTLTHANNPN